MKSKTFHDAGNEHKAQWEPSEKGLRRCMTLCQVASTGEWSPNSIYNSIVWKLGEKSERNQHVRVCVCVCVCV